jgi:predicted O-linked N-acetylglucosamine transferase (SPINDLY family)
MNSRSPRPPNRNQQIKPLPMPKGANHIARLLEQGLDHFRQGNIAAVTPLYAEVLRLDPLNFDALHLLGVIAYQSQDFLSAVNLIAQALVIKPKDSSALNNIASALIELSRFDEAREKLNLAVAIKDDYAEAYFNLGNLNFKTKKFQEAIGNYKKAIEIKEADAGAYNNIGSVQIELNQFEDALHSFGQAIKINPDFADAHFNNGNVFRKLKRHEEAIECYLIALKIIPNHFKAYCNLGASLVELGRVKDAEDCYNKAISINPNYAEAHYNLANVLKKLKRYGEALQSFDLAISLNYSLVEAHSNRGTLLAELKQIDSAVVSYKNALLIEPDLDYVFGQMLHLKMKQCDWSNFDEMSSIYIQGIADQKKIMPPFAALSLIDYPALHFLCSKVFTKNKYPKSDSNKTYKNLRLDEKIRIGYFSADFHNHATMHLMVQMFELHDQNKFEIYGFSFGPSVQDEMRFRASKSFYKFFDVSEASDIEIACISRDCGIDIAVDLKGHTQDARTGIFAQGAAPIQISYLGYPGTMGAEYIDYIIADEVVIPKECQAYYSEKVIYLPCCYQVNDSNRKISDIKFSKEQLGLPNSGFIFCCFNNNYKITPEVFDCWMRILDAVEGSVLWLLEDNEFASNNLRFEAKSKGISSDRLIFASRMPSDEHLARHRLADLFLDTYPCNAHTTASDSLWAGLPVLTFMGESFASRVAASLLNTLNLEELITESIIAYEKLAIQLAMHPSQLNEIKQKLSTSTLNSPLFRTETFTRHLEDAYVAAYKRHKDDKLPDHIYVADKK